MHAIQLKGPLPGSRHFYTKGGRERLTELDKKSGKTVPQLKGGRFATVAAWMLSGSNRMCKRDGSSPSAYLI